MLGNRLVVPEIRAQLYQHSTADFHVLTERPEMDMGCPTAASV